MRHITLNQLQQGAEAQIINYDGGCGLINKLEAMGLRTGKIITKISGAFIGGPVTVKVDNIKVAIGKGMADKIIVGVD